MKILILHNRYQFAGGEEAVVQAEKALLEAKGHAVRLIETTNDEIQGVGGKAKAAVSAIYSHSAKQRVGEEIQWFLPDVLHVHNFFPLLSPSVYDAACEAQIPVVQTLHNYRLGCPNALLFREGRVCEECLGKAIPWPGVKYGCYRGSRSQSAVTATMLAAHTLRQTWQNRVTRYIVLTQFQKNKMIQAGLPPAKLQVKPNFVALSVQDTLQRQPFALYVGRLSIEKGVQILIQAYQCRNLQFPLKIVGTGPLLEDLQNQVKAANLQDCIELLGWQEKSTVLHLMQSAQFLVFPSIWYEPFGLSVIEAFACSLPVIVSRLGSLAEIVENQVTGLHFEAGDATDLASKLEWAVAHPQALREMGRRANQVYADCYTADANYEQLLAIYQQAIQVAKTRSCLPGA
ncbi:glycosyltransferase family 4 protein [Desertifilum sp. FACHB-1129]|uniref:Glycosyl transferase family 1 n=1 Tax=Desertifilum tharense IPPAS B-1220 TaxID=1781255 RepID=A0A1E5QIQ2_9CYAN|nr:MULTISPECIES: glycosyltransferase family 4 protein [Desertifilum]MDA0210533.1 glycosyltransferase family 4 protein [Cyanobacteria bacterium FC1]MBD2311533.1 glycosyltransferase family 4 protein [Desertifilum sp. FACHB-1129]MBD2323107.1 glycosyltransferase family 4 protein [Desertifilum sp. FACHB-866]MBD2332952.1 glycosyltransferase family 4 protein [Desertifilum sp. FACHB-868]OEJ74559.1 glycosyl transferase family 1 [Desertifilum tharense IPPAS B-1220]